MDVLGGELPMHGPAQGVAFAHPILDLGRSTASLAMRRSRHCAVRAANSISVMSSQLLCLGV